MQKSQLFLLIYMLDFHIEIKAFITVLPSTRSPMTIKCVSITVFEICFDWLFKLLYILTYVYTQYKIMLPREREKCVCIKTIKSLDTCNNWRMVTSRGNDVLWQMKVFSILFHFMFEVSTTKKSWPLSPSLFRFKYIKFLLAC